jgi:hypothetical protein
MWQEMRNPATNHNGMVVAVRQKLVIGIEIRSPYGLNYNR